MGELKLRPFDTGDEVAARSAQDELQRDGFTFLLQGFDPDEPWEAYVARLRAASRGEGLEPGWVPADLWAADVDGELVGRTSIRHRLNDHLAQFGGHIGYGVRPAFRRRGHATRILELSLARARDIGVTSALLTCDDENVASAATIERCGGVFEKLAVGEHGRPIRRYWVPTA